VCVIHTAQNSTNTQKQARSKTARKKIWQEKKQYKEVRGKTPKP